MNVSCVTNLRYVIFNFRGFKNVIVHRRKKMTFEELMTARDGRSGGKEMEFKQKGEKRGIRKKQLYQRRTNIGLNLNNSDPTLFY